MHQPTDDRPTRPGPVVQGKTQTGRRPPEGSVATAAERLGEDVSAVLRLGGELARAGTGSYRVEQAMKRAAAALGVDRLDAAVTMTTICVTARRGDEFRTIVHEVHDLGVDAGRIAALEGVAHEAVPGTTAAVLHGRLDAVARLGRRWSLSARSLAAGLGCAAFALLNGFTAWDAVAVLVAAGVGQAVRGRLTREGVAPLGVVGACSALSCLVFLALVAGASSVTGAPAGMHEAGFVAALLYLVPGFPLFTGLLDLAHLDIVAGCSRLAYAATVVGTSSGVVWLLSSLTGASPVVPVTATPPLLAHLLLWAVWSLVGVSAFAVLFDARLRMVVLAGAIGAVANVTRLGLTLSGAPAQTACFVAGLCIGLLASVAAARARVPRITVSVPAAIIMIPGTAMYRALYHLNAGAMASFLSETATVVLLLTAIGAGLALARLLTDPVWAVDRG